MTFQDKRKGINRRVYYEKEYNNFLAKKFPPSRTKCGLTASQIMDRWNVTQDEAYRLTRLFGIQAFGRRIIPFDVAQSPEFLGTLGVFMKRHAQRRQDDE